MSDTLLTVFNVAAEDDVCRTFLPYWERTGYDIMFSSPYDARSQLDYVLHFHAGRAMTRDRSSWWFYQSRILETFKFVLRLPYNRFVFTQYDSIALGPLPAINPDTGNIHHIAGGPMPQFKAKVFLHPPWCFGRGMLERFVTAAAKHNIETTEYGVMDRWIAYVMEQDTMPIEDASPWSWSMNAIDTPALEASARAAIQRGCLFVHGVKNLDQLCRILPP